MKIILLNGQGGTGKTTVAQILRESVDQSAYIEADSLTAVTPFEFEKLDSLLHKNAISLINNFAEEGYKTIITTGLTKNQKELDSFLGKLELDAEILFVWLRASEEVRKERKASRSRDKADSPEHFEFTNKIYPDVTEFTLPKGKILEIDTSKKTPEEVAKEIISLI